MSKQSHQKHEEKVHHESHGTHSSKSGGLHKDWRTWTVVILMLAAMAIYVLSQDEAIEPGGQTEEPVPAAAE